MNTININIDTNTLIPAPRVIKKTSYLICYLLSEITEIAPLQLASQTSVVSTVTWNKLDFFSSIQN